MTRDDIIRMMREAALPPLICDSPSILALCEAVARRSAAAEREACANLAEETVCDTHLPTGVKIYGWRVSKAIRARGQAIDALRAALAEEALQRLTDVHQEIEAALKERNA
jgi:hypothetical protein